MKLIEKGNKCDYMIDESGVIYRKYKYGLKEVEKRLGTRGYCEFKMNNKTVIYHQVVAKMLIPNTKGCNKVFFNSDDRFDMRPENLRWVWTRENRTYTRDEALSKTNDKYLILYYNSGDRNHLDMGIEYHLRNMYEKCNTSTLNSLMGELMICIYNYAERNLLFDLKSDLIGTYIGLCRQRHRSKLKLVPMKDYYIAKQELNLYDEFNG